MKELKMYKSLLRTLAVLWCVALTNKVLADTSPDLHCFGSKATQGGGVVMFLADTDVHEKLYIKMVELSKKNPHAVIQYLPIEKYQRCKSEGVIGAEDRAQVFVVKDNKILARYTPDNIFSGSDIEKHFPAVSKNSKNYYEQERGQFLDRFARAAVMRREEPAKSYRSIALLAYPDMSNTYFYSAKVSLMSYVQSDNYFGYSYSAETIKEAAGLLEQSLQQSDSSGGALSLLLHVYTVGGDMKNADAVYQRIKTKPVKDAWLDTNLAAYFYIKQDYSQSFNYLTKATSPSADNGGIGLTELRARDKLNQKLAASLRVKSPAWDSNPLVKSGVYKRLDSAEVENFLKTKTNNRPAVVVFTSESGTCSHCVKDLSIIAKPVSKYTAMYDFYLVTFEPWTSVSEFAFRNQLNLGGLPASYIFHKGKIINASRGALLNTVSFERFLIVGDIYLQNKRYDRFVAGDGTDKFSLSVKSFEFNHVLFIYAGPGGHKALAMAFIETGGFYWGLVANKASAAEAEAGALAQCQASVKKNPKSKLQFGCELVFVDERFTYTHMNEKTKQIVFADAKGFFDFTKKQAQQTQVKH